MARSNSPGYPNMSLPKAISAVRKMFDADRRNPIDRISAAKHIGYSGQSGASDKALGSLAHYGLTEKTGKGELRVSQLAVDILHPDPTNPGSEARALWQAGMNPQVFKDLRNRFPGHVSEESLRSYLVREGFNNVAISPVMNAFFETFRFLEQYKDFESGGGEQISDAESGDEPAMEADVIPNPAQQASPKPDPAVTMMALHGLNKINMNIQGDKVTLAATLDRRGLALLEKKLAHLKLLLEPMEMEDDANGEENDFDSLNS